MIKTMRNCITVFIVLSSLYACAGKPAEQQSGQPQTAAPSAQPVSASDSDWPEKIKIKTPDDKPIVELKRRGDDIKLEFGIQVLRGKVKDSGKRKYEPEGGSDIAEVKADDQGFKLRTPDGKLLWKVKIADDKIKISDNEEGQNPYELKFKGDEVKVERNQSKLGEVKFYRDRQKVKVKDAADAEKYESNTDRYSAMYGVLLLSQVPERERYIIMAELLARGK
jgi:uncharacterized protein YkuJ